MGDPNFSLGEAEQLAALMNDLDAQGDNPDIPQDIRDLLRNVKRQKGDKSDDQAGQEVLPEPGFVVKTTDDKGRKVFLNICGSAKVDPPGSFVDGKLPPAVQQTLAKLEADGQALSDQELQSLRLPLSCGQPRADLDHRAEPCTTIDIVFNLDAIKQAAAVRTLKYFIINIALEWASQKFGAQLDPKFKLPKMKYKGEAVQPQRIRMEKQALVKEIGDVPDEPVFPLLTKKKRVQPPPHVPAATQHPSPTHLRSQSATTSSATAPGGPPPGQPEPEQQALSHTVAFSGRPVDTIVLTVETPAALSSAEHVDVQSCAQEVQVSIRGCKPLRVALPFAVAEEGAEAVLGAGGLVLRLPVRSMRSMVEQLRRESPHTPGSIKLANSACYELEA